MRNDARFGGETICDDDGMRYPLCALSLSTSESNSEGIIDI
jgi:hypothetical protein